MSDTVNTSEPCFQFRVINNVLFLNMKQHSKRKKLKLSVKIFIVVNDFCF